MIRILLRNAVIVRTIKKVFIARTFEICLLHFQPIYLDDKIIGRTTSGNYSFNFNKNLTFGYVDQDLSNLDTSKNKLYIEVGKVKYEAEYLAKPLNQNNYKTI